MMFTTSNNSDSQPSQAISNTVKRQNPMTSSLILLSYPQMSCSNIPQASDERIRFNPSAE